MSRVDTFEGASGLEKRYPPRVGTIKKVKDTVATAVLWRRHYFGVEPRSMYEAARYRSRLKAAAAEADSAGWQRRRKQEGVA
jgi:hypothetical protein